MGSSVNRSLQMKNTKARKGAIVFGVDMSFKQAIDKAYYTKGVMSKDYTVADRDIVILTDVSSIDNRFRRHF